MDFSYRCVVGILFLTAAAGIVRASEIYKSVDANGNTVYSDHLDPSLSRSTVVQLEETSVPPRELHFCWTNCFTLVLDNGAYRRIDGTDETWTVETFSANAIVLHRHDAPADWNGQSQDVVYAGQMANDRLIGVTVNGKPTSGIDASWGSALNTLPGSNAERDASDTPNLGSTGGTVSSNITPPPLQQEDQPQLTQDGFEWTPGCWYWRDQSYFWIPGSWMRPPQVGFLWTPGYWDAAGAVFVFHPGHWGSTVGFYGGVNYGYGYFGNGYSGGHWIGNAFAYNTAVNHVNPAVAHHTFAESVPNQNSQNVAGYTTKLGNGGATHSSSPPQSLTQSVDRAAMTQTAQRARVETSMPTRISNASTVVKTSAPAGVPKSNHVTGSRAEPVKQ